MLLNDPSPQQLTTYFRSVCEACRENEHEHWSLLCPRHVIIVRAILYPETIVRFRERQQDLIQRIATGEAWLDSDDRTERERDLGIKRLNTLSVELAGVQAALKDIRGFDASLALSGDERGRAPAQPRSGPDVFPAPKPKGVTRSA